MSERTKELINDNVIEEFIRETYELNFELMRLELGASLSPEVKYAGLMQVLLYWRTMKDVALNVTDTEVRLSLPRQESPNEREFGIEGVVDIVRDEEKTLMYDVKTHDADYVRSHIDLYEDQLNVYAYIWQNLHKQSLDGTAVICTKFPDEVQEALSQDDATLLERAIARWDPLIEIAFKRRRVEETIREFGKVVDAIEEHAYAPPPVSKLQEPYAEGHQKRFATHVCRNCDARFSCASYRKYARHGRGRVERNFAQFYSILEVGDPLEEWRTTGLDAAPEVEDLI